MVSSVIVNIHSEMDKLPLEIAKAQKTLAGSAYPYVILADPALTKVYGTYNHTKLKGQNYREIFRDAKRAASDDMKADKFNTELEAASKEEPEETSSESTETSPPTKTTPAQAESEIIKIANPKMKSWVSSRGSKIEAKLMGVENKKTFIFLTSAGKTLRVTGDKLSLDSLKAAKKLAGLDE